MPDYLVETYLGHGVPGERSSREERARLAAAELTRQGVHVSFERSIHVPADELCFFVFEAADGHAAALVAARAGLDAIRVVAADCSGSPTT